MFNRLSIAFHIQICHRIHIHGAVRIPPGYRRDVECPVKHLHRLLHELGQLRDYRNHCGGQSRLTDVRADIRYQPVGHGEGQMLHSAKCLDHKICLVRQPVIVYIFSDAAQSVAAHFPLRTIRVEHPHTEVPFLGRTDQYHSVRTDCKMTVTDKPRQLRQIL